MELSLESWPLWLNPDVDNAIAKLSGLIKQDNSKLDLWNFWLRPIRGKGTTISLD